MSIRDFESDFAQVEPGFGLITADSGSAPALVTGAANAATVRTYAAEVGKRHVLTALVLRFSGANGAVTVIVEDGAGTTVWDQPVAASQTTDLNVPLPAGGIRGSINTALIVTVPAGGAGITSTLKTAKKTLED